MKLRDFSTVKDRRRALEDELGISFIHIADYSLDDEQASNRNCENMIGAIQVPLGIAGPLLIKDERVRSKEYYIPLATTEGALVASVNRGCKAITISGGATVKVERVGVTRTPVFAVDTMHHAEKVEHWLEKNYEALKEKTEETSKHLTLLKVASTSLGRNVFVKFFFDSQDAMGMNMATIAVSAVTGYIEEKTGARLIAVSSNLCTDKKPSFRNFIEGRGYKVQAEVVIPDSVISDVLKTTTENLLETYQKKIFYGSALSGSLGYNAQYANILAAVFLATGQDVAHVSECAIGMTIFEKHENGISASVFLPDLMVGTVGGGTELATQKESLSILGIAGGNKGKNAEKFAGSIAGSVLAGEISLVASLAANTLACAHEMLARGK